MITYGTPVITRQSGYPVTGVIETFAPVVMADGSVASAAVVRITCDAGLYRRGDVAVIPVANLEAVA